MRHGKVPPYHDFDVSVSPAWGHVDMIWLELDQKQGLPGLIQYYGRILPHRTTHPKLTAPESTRIETVYS